MLDKPNHHLKINAGGKPVSFDLRFHSTWVGKRTYEPEVIDVMGRFVQPGDYVIDAGANLGFFSLLLSRLVGDNGAVLAFEPDPSCYKDLIENIKLNATNNIVSLGVALWQEDCWMNFWLMEESGYSSFVQYVQSKEPMKMQVRSLDSLLKGAPVVPRLIKLDCEGAEGAILYGAEQQLKSGIDCVITEFNFSIMSQVPIPSERDIRDYMHGLGYDYFTLAEGQRPCHVPHDHHLLTAGADAVYTNVMFSTLDKVNALWPTEKKCYACGYTMINDICDYCDQRLRE